MGEFLSTAASSEGAITIAGDEELAGADGGVVETGAAVGEDETRPAGREEEIVAAGDDEEAGAATLAWAVEMIAAVVGIGGRVGAPVPITASRKAVIQPSKASNSCFS